MIALALGLWLAAMIAAWLSRRRERRQQAWLRSDVPATVAYARLRQELERRCAHSDLADEASER
jgi:hypothetical protein